ncbi:MAG TPA: molybdopterin-dependent oxidoreductase [Spirochaetia bacterium]|nr:molybdopterin-dependent oxidoreductase [Spirochaetia bacterium]
MAQPQVVSTTCRFCLNGCGIRVRVAGDRILSVEGDPGHPFSRGYLCPKGLAARDIVNSSHRLSQPLLRAGARGEGKWREISWPDALDLLAERLDEVRLVHGPEAFGVFRGQGPGWGGSWDYLIRFMNAFGSPHTFGTGHICYVPKYIAQTVTYAPPLVNGWIPVPEYENTRCLVEWGTNYAATDVARMYHLQAALDRGARLIAIDPVATATTSRADIWLRPYPGTDGYLALSMARVIVEEQLFDQDFVREWTHGFPALEEHLQAYAPEATAQFTGVSPDMVRQAARLYATTSPGHLQIGGGIDKYPQALQTARAITILPVLTGNVDVPGGNPVRGPLPVKNVRSEPDMPDDYLERLDGYHRRYPLMYRYFRQVPGSLLPDAILEGNPYPLRSLLVIGGNPALCLANSPRVREALLKVDFLAAVDIFPTRTTALADLVLPGVSSLERTDLEVLDDRVILRDAVIKREGSVPDLQLILELAKRLGLGARFPWSGQDEMIDYQLAPLNVTVAGLRSDPGRGLVNEPRQYRKYRSGRFATPTGKAELVATTLEQAGYDGLPCIGAPPEREDSFPLLGTSGPASPLYVHTQFRQIPSLRAFEPCPLVRLNPVDATNRGIGPGDMVVIRSSVGTAEMKAEISETVGPGIVLVGWGWGEVSANGSINELVSDQPRDPLTGTTANRFFWCEISPARSRDGNRLSQPGEEVVAGP